jgi:hypothetical protein
MPNRTKQFLEKISMIESSGGKNVEHSTMKSGIHKGNAAIGRYGLMPNTIKEIAKRQKMAGMKNSYISDIEKLDNNELRDYLEKNPKVEEQLAITLANKVLDKMKGDETKAAFAWNQGHNLTPDRIQKSKYLDHPYTKKFLNLNKSDDDRKIASEPNKLPYEEVIEPEEKPQRSSFMRTIDVLKDKAGDGLSYLGEKLSEGDFPIKKFNMETRQFEDVEDGLKIDPLGMIGGIKKVAQVGAKTIPEMRAALEAAEKGKVAAMLEKYGSKLPEKQVVEEVIEDVHKMREAGKPRSVPASAEAYLPENIAESSLIKQQPRGEIFEKKPIDIKPLRKSGDFPEYDVLNPLEKGSEIPVGDETYNRLKKLLGSSGN